MLDLTTFMYLKKDIDNHHSHKICRSLSRYGNSSDKVNRGMILAPLAGIILNLLDASKETDSGDWNDIVATFASMDCADTILYGFQHLLEYNWVSNISLSSLGCI